MTSAPSDALKDKLQHEQERAVFLTLLREQENLARMEELRSRQELEDFIHSLQHEKKVKDVLRQQEMDELWAHVSERHKEEARRRRLEDLRHVRDSQALQVEIDDLRRELADRREHRQRLQREKLTSSALAGALGSALLINANASDSMKASHEMNASTGFASTEWALMARTEERLESLLAAMEKLTSTGSTLTGVDTSLRSVVSLPKSRTDLASSLSIPTLPCVPAFIIVASKGVSRVDPYPPTGTEIPRPLPGYNSSTRSLNVVRHPDGEVPILLAGHRRGVTHLDPSGGQVIANYPLQEAKHYAVNSAEFLADGRLLATHSEMGLLGWGGPERLPKHLSGEYRSARLLRALPGGNEALFSCQDQLVRFDADGDQLTRLRDFQGRIITSLAVAGRIAVIGDSQGAVSLIHLDDTAAMMPPFLVGEKVYTLGLLDWRGSVWLAAGVKRRTGIYLTLTDLHGEQPELMLSIPERIHTVRTGGAGILVACSERFLSYWDLNRSQQSRILSLGAVAPIQDFALMGVG